MDNKSVFSGHTAISIAQNMEERPKQVTKNYSSHTLICETAQILMEFAFNIRFVFENA